MKVWFVVLTVAMATALSCPVFGQDVSPDPTKSAGETTPSPVPAAESAPAQAERSAGATTPLPQPVLTPGPQGPRGEAGAPGPRGHSARGRRGRTGATGATGPQGPRGEKGDTGRDGKNGRDGREGQDGAVFYTPPLFSQQGIILMVLVLAIAIGLTAWALSNGATRRNNVNGDNVPMGMFDPNHRPSRQVDVHQPGFGSIRHSVTRGSAEMEYEPEQVSVERYRAYADAVATRAQARTDELRLRVEAGACRSYAIGISQTLVADRQARDQQRLLRVHQAATMPHQDEEEEPERPAPAKPAKPDTTPPAKEKPERRPRPRKHRGGVEHQAAEATPVADAAQPAPTATATTS